MTTLTLEEPEAPVAEPNLRCDTLAESVAMLIFLTMIQPIIGFVRSILFCRWLSPSELGQWDVVQGFLMLAAPLAVWGIPGSFGRYCAYYRHRGQLKSYLVRTSLLMALLASTALVVMLLVPDLFSRLIFGETTSVNLIPLVVLALGIVIGFGYVIELLTALRLFRVVSGLQLLRSAGFLGFGIALLWGWKLSASSVVVGYAAASLLTVAVGLFWLRWAWRMVEEEPVAMPYRNLVRKVAPFALWIWVSNALTNLFEVVDRYMIVHFSPLSAEEVLREVGNYHSARVVPLLLVAFSGTLASMLLPHFSHHWEEGHVRLVGQQRNLVLKVFGGAQFLFAVLVLIAAPWLFGTVLEGKYAGGQAILPWTLIYCLWFCLGLVAETSLWCAEEARLGTIALIVGMVVTVALNLVLLPRYGLPGAVLATAAGKLTLMLLAYGFNNLVKLPIDRGTWLISLAPLALLGGPWGAGGSFLVLLLLAATTRLILTDEDHQQLSAFISDYYGRLRGMGRRTPA